MRTTDEIIEALHRGRKVRPIQYRTYLFLDDDKACALGAIAIGFGYDPIRIVEIDGYSWFSEDSAYDLLRKELGHDLMDQLWKINDDSWKNEIMRRDPDQAVEEFLRTGKINSGVEAEESFKV